MPALSSSTCSYGVVNGMPRCVTTASQNQSGSFDRAVAQRVEVGDAVLASRSGRPGSWPTRRWLGVQAVRTAANLRCARLATRPSRMSLSDTSSSSMPSVRTKATSAQQPPTITSARASSNPGLWIRSARRSVASVRNTSSIASRVRWKWWIWSRSYSASPISTARDGRDGAGQADDGARPPVAPGTSRTRSSNQAVASAMALDSSSGAGGSLVEVLLGEADAPDVERADRPRPGRCRPCTRSSRRRCRRPGTARGSGRGRRWRRRSSARPPRSPLRSSGRVPTTASAAAKKSSALLASRAR